MLTRDDFYIVHLEERVKLRTIDLTAANEQLKNEVVEREKVEAKQTQLLETIEKTNDKLDEDGKEQMELLSSRVNRMHNLIEGVLQYSRVGRVEEQNEQVNLNELIADVIDMVSPPENISITIENELPVVYCDQTRIMQVFQNLLSNAIKYMDKPDGQISVGCKDDADSWVFYVKDNGPGIEEKYFKKIFQIFQTLSARDDFESTGVGLTVTKKIVELYGGKIWVESKPGDGSTFFFSILKKSMGARNEKYEANIIS